MQFIKNLFKDEAIIGLSGLRKRREAVVVNIPETYKRAYVQNVQKNYYLV